jgi:hypothetical protein
LERKVAKGPTARKLTFSPSPYHDLKSWALGNISLVLVPVFSTVLTKISKCYWGKYFILAHLPWCIYVG